MGKDKGITPAKSMAIRLADAGTEETIENKIVVCEQIPALDVLRLALERSANQIIQEKNPHWEAEMKASAIMLAAPRSFMDMPMATILSPDDLTPEAEKRVTEKEIVFSSSEEKNDVLESVNQTLRDFGCADTFCSDVRLVADELFTNAIFNAAFTHTKGISRNQKVVVDKPCRIFIGRSEERLVVGCEDPYGSLNIRKLLAQIRRCEEDGAQRAITWGMGGAGLGSYIVFQNAMSMFYGVEEGKRTIVAAIFPLGKGSRARSKIAKSVHFIGIGKDE